MRWELWRGAVAYGWRAPQRARPPLVVSDGRWPVQSQAALPLSSPVDLPHTRRRSCFVSFTPSHLQRHLNSLQGTPPAAYTASYPAHSARSFGSHTEFWLWHSARTIVEVDLAATTRACTKLSLPCKYTSFSLECAINLSPSIYCLHPFAKPSLPFVLSSALTILRSCTLSDFFIEIRVSLPLMTGTAQNRMVCHWSFS